MAALEAQKHTLQTRIAEHAAPTVAPWGPYAGPPPFTPPNAPDFDEWYAAQLAEHPDYTREHAYGHFYNLARDPSGAPGYTDGVPGAG